MQKFHVIRLFVLSWICMLKGTVLQAESATERDLWIDAVNAAAEVSNIMKVSAEEASSDS